MKTTYIVPKVTDHLLVGPASQVNIHASPLSYEAKQNAAAIARECQGLADQFGLPVVLTVDMGSWTDRHTFNPVSV